MADRRNLILALGAATSATALVVGGIMTANALTVDDSLGQVTATAGVGTESILDEAATDPTPTPSPTDTPVPAPADPVVAPAQPVVPATPVDVSGDATSKEQHRDARWDDGDPANDSWWCDDAGSWHWGDHPADPAAAPTTAARPTSSDPGTAWGSGTDQPSSGDSGSWNGGNGGGYSGNGHGGGSWGGGGGDRP